MLDTIVFIAIYYVLLTKKWLNLPMERRMYNTLFFFYVYLVCAVTLFPIVPQFFALQTITARQLNMLPFVDVLNGYGNFIEQLLLNVLLTMPFGFLLPFGHRRIRLIKTTFYTLLLSVTIESLQWLMHSNRIADITDVFTNTLGGMIGYLCYKCIYIYMTKEKK